MNQECISERQLVREDGGEQNLVYQIGGAGCHLRR